jgi:hypothetical protein
LKDILLCADGDLFISDQGDICLTDSVSQAIQIRLRWFLQEWRLGPMLGLPYYEEVFVKNPNLPRIQQIIRDEIMTVAEVTDALNVSVEVNAITRQAAIYFEAVTTEEIIRGEVCINV